MRYFSTDSKAILGVGCKVHNACSGFDHIKMLFVLFLQKIQMTPPLVWTMLKKTALFLHDGFPYQPVWHSGAKRRAAGTSNFGWSGSPTHLLLDFFQVRWGPCLTLAGSSYRCHDFSCDRQRLRFQLRQVRPRGRKFFWHSGLDKAAFICIFRWIW